MTPLAKTAVVVEAAPAVPPPANAARHMSGMLAAGILLMPHIFSWVTLRPGYTARARFTAFGWLAFVGGVMALAVAGSEPVPSNALASIANSQPPSPTQPFNAPTVESLSVLLHEYSDNEVRADSRFKGRRLRVSGRVGDVKKDIGGSIYVTVGTGSEFEIPVVQCFLDNGASAVASRYSKGSRVTVDGVVSGLMMNVLMQDCTIVP